MDYHQTPPRNRFQSYRTHSTNSSSSGPLSAGNPRPRSQLSRESTCDPKETSHIASDFLRSALDRERASRRTTIDHNERIIPNDRIVQGSPISRSATADPSRRRHRADSAGLADHHGPLGAKEASEAISKLHNDNFNLKLEVFHRREREVSLEERVQKLELELAERDQIEESLRADLVSRDTEIKTQTVAVQEAVNVIMDLEAKLEKYRQGEAMDGEEAVPHTPRAATRAPSRLEDEITALARMPSFVSDLSTNTENLRNVYLNNQGSAVNLERGDGIDTRAYTPSLSILDEIYGDVRQSKLEPPMLQQAAPVHEMPVRRTKEEKRQAIEKALEDMPISHRNPRYEKREALHPVLTGMPMDSDALPPTPDTMSSSTLERGRRSKDTLSRQPSIPEDQGRGRGPSNESMCYPSVRPLATVYNNNNNNNNPKGLDPIPRPRSASEATTAPRWDMSDTESMESDVDIWMRERGRVSPDLFNFPSASRWDSDQEFSGYAPPPPNRRSSLQARTSTPGRPRTRGTPSIVRSERFSNVTDERDGATPPPILLKRTHVDVLRQPDDGGVSLTGPNITPPTTAISQPAPNSGPTQVMTTPNRVLTAPNTPTGPMTPNSVNQKRRWFGLGRVGSLRKG